MNVKHVLAVLLIAAIILVALIYVNTRTHNKHTGLPILDVVSNKPCTIKVYSPAINNGSDIPRPYTCDGRAVSPPLVIAGIPKNVKELVIIMYDPDAPHGVFYHWLLYNIKPLTRVTIPEGIPPLPIVSGIGAQGVNSYGRIGYGPPCPPRGEKHRYVFLVVGLDQELKLPPGLIPDKLLSLIREHIIACGILYGYYSR